MDFSLKGLVPDAAALDPKTKVPNAAKAMDAAEKWLDVPQVGGFICIFYIHLQTI